MFKRCEFNTMPAAVRREGATYIVTRNVTEVERDGEIAYVGEIAYMSESAYFAYAGATEVAARREQEIVDETILNLIEEGSL